MSEHPRETDDAIDPTGVLVVRAGPGANCSSIGSAVEMLFLSATLGAAVLAAVAAALRPAPARPPDAPPADPDPAASPREPPPRAPP